MCWICIYDRRWSMWWVGLRCHDATRLTDKIRPDQPYPTRPDLPDESVGSTDGNPTRPDWPDRPDKTRPTRSQVCFFLLLMAGESPPPLDLVKLSKCANVAKKTAKRKVQFLWVITNSLDTLLMFGAFQSDLIHELPKTSLDIGLAIQFHILEDF